MNTIPFPEQLRELGHVLGQSAHRQVIDAESIDPQPILAVLTHFNVLVMFAF
jgi:tryptophan synthase beta subunit